VGGKEGHRVKKRPEENLCRDGGPFHTRTIEKKERRKKRKRANKDARRKKRTGGKNLRCSADVKGRASIS